ncbi:MAG TPA: peptidoglycan DD-metalloendopeptidase family protein [Polyangia bacterium]
MGRIGGLLAFVTALASPLAAGAEEPAAKAAEPASAAYARLDARVRDGRIARDAARREVARLVPLLAAEHAAGRCAVSPRDGWAFPLAGYDAGAIGGRRGSGYQPAGYDWFDGNRHGGHPAHDLFIRDRDQDGRDDRTGAAVVVRSVSSGLVVALNEEWDAASPLRGGKYVWVYDPASGGLFYYAHLARVAVAVGACVVAGTPLGEVGRTGVNAAKRRSPTHLHLMSLAVVEGAPRPRDLYRDLVRAGRAR